LGVVVGEPPLALVVVVSPADEVVDPEAVDVDAVDGVVAVGAVVVPKARVVVVS
jgi:hypothetical protein